MTIIGFTGHTNIEKANGVAIEKGGMIYNTEAFNLTKKDISTKLDDLLLDKNISDYGIVSGMARGADEIAAMIAMERDLPLLLSIPNSIKWHISRPPSRGIMAQAIQYKIILNYVRNRIDNGCEISKIREIKKYYRSVSYPYANMARNQNIIDMSDYVISYLRYSSTGTNDAIKKAKEANKYYGNS